VRLLFPLIVGIVSCSLLPKHSIFLASLIFFISSATLLLLWAFVKRLAFKTVTAGAVTFDCNLADIFATTLVTGTPTAITLSNARAGSYVIRLKQSAGGSATVTWATTIVWAGGSAPTLTTTANYSDIITLIYDGTTWRGTATLNFAS
jgi:hypothetical protein